MFRFCFIKATYQQTVVGVPVVGTPITVREQPFIEHGPIDKCPKFARVTKSVVNIKHPYFDKKS